MWSAMVVMAALCWDADDVAPRREHSAVSASRSTCRQVYEPGAGSSRVTIGANRYPLLAG